MTGRACRAFAAALACALAAHAGSALAAPQQYAIDVANTHVHWELVHFGTSTSRGRFDAIRGSVTLDRTTHSGNASFSIATGSVSTGSALFDGVLRGPYLLAAAENPTAWFVANRFPFDGDQIGPITGEFTLRGQSQPLTLRALHFACRTEAEPAQREVCGGDFETEFDRSNFGITHSLPFVADKVRVLVQIEAVRQ